MRGMVSLFFRWIHGYWPRFINPRSFSEKIWHRMLFDRDPRLTLFSDKLRVREYVSQRAGERYLIPLLWQGTNPEQIPFDVLPSRFVIKATHGCGYNILVRDKSKLEQASTILQFKKWLREDYGSGVYVGVQWGYRNIVPSIVVEEFLGSVGSTPWDYKIYCFSGRALFVEIHMDRFGNHVARMLDRDFNPVDLCVSSIAFQGTVPTPENKEELIQVAEALAEGLDFMRVDLYAIDGRVYFGEMTCYQGGGCNRFGDREGDFWLGQKWQLANAMQVKSSQAGVNKA
jgi:hypothetical protein